jgi:hypothetical protein
MLIGPLFTEHARIPRLPTEPTHFFGMVIRTRLVELSSLEATAYRQKLGNGRSGVVILRSDTPQPGLALLNRNTGEPDLAPNVPPDLFPLEAFKEALELTSGLPYSSRGKVSRAAAASRQGEPAAMEEQENAPEDVATVCSADYAAIVKAYTNRKGELSYDLLNKSLIQAARSNPFVAEMAARKASLDEIRDHVVLANFQAVSGNRGLGLAEMHRIVALLDEVSPRSVLRELNDEIRRMLA